jgi:hypothetical protein
MIGRTALFVSKRLQRVGFAFICLIAAQMLATLAARHAGPAPVSARVAITLAQ